MGFNTSLIKLASLGFLLLVALFLPSAVHAQASPVKIMVVGDSISQGHSGDYTWRYRLWQHLTASSVNFDFVGPKTTLYDDVNANGTNDYLEPNFDRDHDATWGRPVKDEKNTIASEMTAADPDVLLIMLGANDLLYFSTPATAAADMGTLITNARSINPDVKIVLSLVTPKSPASDQFNTKRTEYNNLLVTLASQMTTTQSPVVISDPTNGFNSTTDTYDDIHPSPSGEYKIAAAYANALASNFSIGSAYGTIPPAPAWPQATTSLTATPGNGQATLNWSAVPGAQGYYVYYRDVTTGQSFTRWTNPVTGTSTTSIWMTNGHTYEFTLSTKRYNFEGPHSAVTSVIPGTLTPPTGLTATPGNGSANLTWNAVTGATGYYVYYRDVTAGQSSFTRWPNAVTGTSTTSIWMTNGHTYEFKLSTRNSVGEGPQSPAVSVVPQP